MATDVKRSANALPDDPDWCGHPVASLRTWTCATCDRPVLAATRARLESQPTVAPPGYLWVLFMSWDGDTAIDPREAFGLDGLFTDRATIARRMIRGRVLDAKDIREILQRLHLYQGVFAHNMFEGWAEEPDQRGCYERYRLELVEIDCV